ncbi:anthranilate phosphoribosyltransferase [Longispora albida]|uniref:anthranilate phosphoribosyltransferase n=1 Tax=Longispora albida TaxID=203523 RepID=UPI00036DD7C6|nr:anthranilate phosphoribosyltransferase [Longispora albida]
MTSPRILTAILSGQSLTFEQAAEAMDEICRGDTGPAALAAFLTALRAKGVTAAELGGFAQAIAAHAIPVDVPGPIVDLAGTGGDTARTVNISTMAAIVVAGAGARVVKHGSRAASAAAGSADVLEALGGRLDLSPEQVAVVAQEAGLTFCFAARFHPAMRHAAPVRRELGIPTVFNLLGPLSNPARPGYQALGTSDLAMAPVLAATLAARGTSALVVRGDDGLDELTVTTTSRVWEVRDGLVTEHRLDPGDLGIARCAPSALRGGDAAFNADVARRVLGGEAGPVRDAVVLNAAAALAALDSGAGPLIGRLRSAADRCAQAIDSGAAQAALDRWVKVSAAQ